MSLLTTFLEFAGTFLLVLVILYAMRIKNIWLLSLTVSLAIFFVVLMINWAGGNGYINPAVTTAFYAQGEFGFGTFFWYVIAQILGALLAVWVFNRYIK